MHVFPLCMLMYISVSSVRVRVYVCTCVFLCRYLCQSACLKPENKDLRSLVLAFPLLTESGTLGCCVSCAMSF